MAKITLKVKPTQNGRTNKVLILGNAFEFFL
jgi:hypothetical protein